MATFAEIIADKQEFIKDTETKLDAKVKSYNEAKADEKTTAKELQAIKDDIDKLSKDHASASRGLAYAKFQSSEEGPMIAACRAGSYPAIKVKEEKIDKDSSETILVVEETVRKVDLGDLHKHCEGIGHDTKWIYALEKLNLMMTASRATELGATPRRLKEINDSYAMSKIAEGYDLGKNPCSKTQMLATLTNIVTMMLGEELGKKVLKFDLRYLEYVYTKADSKSLLKVKCATHKQMRVYLLSICHRIVTDGVYDVDFKVAKKS